MRIYPILKDLQEQDTNYKTAEAQQLSKPFLRAYLHP